MPETRKVKWNLYQDRGIGEQLTSRVLLIRGLGSGGSSSRREMDANREKGEQGKRD